MEIDDDEPLGEEEEPNDAAHGISDKNSDDDVLVHHDHMLDAPPDSDEESVDENEENINFDVEDNSYAGILKKLSQDWILSEIHHRVSKEASNDLFELGKKWFHQLFQAKEREGVLKNTPKFVSIRRKLNDKYVPKINLDVAYKHKETGEITIVPTRTTMPVSEFPSSEYMKLYEIASVDVSKMPELNTADYVLQVGIRTKCFEKHFNSAKSYSP